MESYKPPCALCGAKATPMISVGYIESGTGPGWTLYACLGSCAQTYAARAFAPDWLRDNLRTRGLWPPAT